MSTSSTVHGITTPEGSDDNDSVAAIGAVITSLEGGSIVRRLSAATIAGLGAGAKPAGLLVYDTTNNKLQLSNGSTFAEPYGLWAAWTCAVTATSNPTSVTQINTAYTRIGNTIHARAALTIPVATKGSGTYYFSLPVTPVSDYYSTYARCAIGVGGYGNVAVGKQCAVSMGSATLVTLQAFSDDAYFDSGDVGGTDMIVRFQVTYEAA